MATELDPVLSFRAAMASEIICNQTKKMHLRFKIEFANMNKSQRQNRSNRFLVKNKQ
jgi:hypothetical protein